VSEGVPVCVSYVSQITDLLTRYRTRILQEVTEAKEHHLQMHLSARLIFERQIELIDELLDCLDEGDEILF